MTAATAQSACAAGKLKVGRLFFLDVSVGGRVVSVNAEGSEQKVIVAGCHGIE